MWRDNQTNRIPRLHGSSFLPAECRRMAERATRRTDMRSFMSFDREKRVPLWRSTIQWCLTFPGLALYKRKRAALRTQPYASAHFVAAHFIIFTMMYARRSLLSWNGSIRGGDFRIAFPSTRINNRTAQVKRTD